MHIYIYIHMYIYIYIYIYSEVVARPPAPRGEGRRGRGGRGEGEGRGPPIHRFVLFQDGKGKERVSADYTPYGFGCCLEEFLRQSRASPCEFSASLHCMFLQLNSHIHKQVRFISYVEVFYETCNIVCGIPYIRACPDCRQWNH